MGRVVAILYAPNTRPPSMPDAVICDFSDYRGPTWLSNQPTWVPIVPVTTRCENNCCSRIGLPIMPGYSIPVAKSQGMTVGANKPATRICVAGLFAPTVIPWLLATGIEYPGMMGRPVWLQQLFSRRASVVGKVTNHCIWH